MKKKACYGADGGRHRYPVTPLKAKISKRLTLLISAVCLALFRNVYSVKINL